MSMDGVESLPCCRELKKLQKCSENQNIIGETYFLRVLCMPAHHQTLFRSFECPQMALKVFHTARNLKNCENVQKIRI
jgi:hypothetical protein